MTVINQLNLPVDAPFPNRKSLHSAIYDKFGFRLDENDVPLYTFAPIGDHLIVMRGKIADEIHAGDAVPVAIPNKGMTVRLVGDLILRKSSRHPVTHKKVKRMIAALPNPSGELARWFDRNAEKHGFKVIEDRSGFEKVLMRPEEEGAGHLGPSNDRDVCNIDVIAEVTDPALLATAMKNGIGEMRAYGFGLLHITTA